MPVSRPSSPSPAALDEIEVKARVTNLAALRRALRRAGARLEFRGRMTDAKYDRGRELKRRDEVLRLRVYRPAGRRGAARAVLGWKGAQRRVAGYRHRPELETAVPDAAAVDGLMHRLRFRIVETVDRRIEVYRLGGATVRIERYPGMDTLLEVEGPPRAIERAIRATGMPRARFLAESLPYFLRAYRRRTGRSPRVAWGGARR
jgi:predicted adenylyl cyclase CyaB